MNRLLLLSLVALVSCSTSRPENLPSQDLQPAIDWLSSYYAEFPVGGGWQFVQAKAEENEVAAIFNIADKQKAQNTQTAAIKVACPGEQEAVWGLLPQGVKLQIQIEHNGSWQGQANCN